MLLMLGLSVLRSFVIAYSEDPFNYDMNDLGQFPFLSIRRNDVNSSSRDRPRLVLSRHSTRVARNHCCTLHSCVLFRSKLTMDIYSTLHRTPMSLFSPSGISLSLLQIGVAPRKWLTTWNILTTIMRNRLTTFARLFSRVGVRSTPSLANKIP